jgi:hypothetical protein
MRHTLYRLLLLGLLLTIAACTDKSTPVSSSQATIPPTSDQGSATPTPQSTILNPQSTITPISNPQSTTVATSGQGPATPTPQSTILNPQSTILNPQSTIINPQSTITPILNPQSTIYNLNAQFDFYMRSLSVDETITYTNNTAQPLKDLLLVVPANRWPGAFQLRGIHWADGEAASTPILDFSLHIHRLSISLPQPLLPGGQVSLSLAYDLALPPIPDPSEAAPQPFGYTSSQSNLVDWYAYIPPYKDGWLVHDPGFWGEYQVFEVGDFHIGLTLVDAPAGLVVAASAPPLDTAQEDGSTYRYQLESARTFALSISPSYQVFSQTVDLGSSSVVVYSYAYVFDIDAGQAALAETARAVKLYSELFGPYPHASLSVVEADFLDGMEYDGLYFLSKGFYNLYDGTPNGYLTAIAVHETAHQWWYGLVGNDQALEPWLDEALCAFTERVYYERFYPEALSQWWQPYRVDYYDPAGLVGESIYDYVGYRAYRDAVYLNGQEFLQAVRLRVGDQAFFAFLKDYITRYRGQIATGQDFFALLATHSDVEIADLVKEFFGK